MAAIRDLAYAILLMDAAKDLQRDGLMERLRKLADLPGSVGDTVRLKK